jgi:hypothetical protein
MKPVFSKMEPVFINALFINDPILSPLAVASLNLALLLVVIVIYSQHDFF